MLSYEHDDLVAGTDEAGRGALAGPVFAAAVLMPASHALDPQTARRSLPRLNDSKRLSAASRQLLAEQIKQNAVAWALGEASAAEVDQINVLQAALLAMRRAVEQLRPLPLQVYVDGPHLPTLAAGVEARAIVDGDALLPCIMAAGILAKTARDQRLVELDQCFPGFGFAQHKGYASQQHLDALERLGPCSEHRRSFRPVAQRIGGLFS
jgi:ribonuclease HII